LTQAIARRYDHPTVNHVTVGRKRVKQVQVLTYAAVVFGVMALAGTAAGSFMTGNFAGHTSQKCQPPFYGPCQQSGSPLPISFTVTATKIKNLTWEAGTNCTNGRHNNFVYGPLPAIKIKNGKFKYTTSYKYKGATIPEVVFQGTITGKTASGTLSDAEGVTTGATCKSGKVTWSATRH
jgi:hypothetical protein